MILNEVTRTLEAVNALIGGVSPEVQQAVYARLDEANVLLGAVAAKLKEAREMVGIEEYKDAAGNATGELVYRVPESAQHVYSKGTQG